MLPRWHLVLAGVGRYYLPTHRRRRIHALWPLCTHGARPSASIPRENLFSLPPFAAAHTHIWDSSCPTQHVPLHIPSAQFTARSTCTCPNPNTCLERRGPHFARGFCRPVALSPPPAHAYLCPAGVYVSLGIEAVAHLLGLFPLRAGPTFSAPIMQRTAALGSADLPGITSCPPTFFCPLVIPFLLLHGCVGPPRCLGV